MSDDAVYSTHRGEPCASHIATPGPTLARALDRPAFFGARWSPPRAASLLSRHPRAPFHPLRRSASMRLMTLEGSRSRGASIFDCFFFSSSLSASSY